MLAAATIAMQKPLPGAATDNLLRSVIGGCHAVLMCDAEIAFFPFSNQLIIRLSTQTHDHYRK